MKIRLYQRGDIKKVVHLFQDTVSILDSKEYSEAEIRNWAPNSIYVRDWEELCLKEFTVVAEADEEIVGFAQINDDGHINAFYCRPDHQGKGIGKKLYAVINDYARTQSIPTIYTEVNASIRPFFLKAGFENVQKQKAVVQGKVKANYIMKKKLS